MTFGPYVLEVDVNQSIATIARWIREVTIGTFRRRGIVVGISGGVDSAVCAALAAKALGKEHVLGVLMPEIGLSSESLRLGKAVAANLDVPVVVEDISDMLEAAGCYQRQSEAIREVIPEYIDGWKFKLTLPPITDRNRLSITSIVVQTSGGYLVRKRLSASAYRKLVAATNFKQRVRKMVEYYHADRLQYAVCCTPNRLEYDQGFFVKNGDGSADLKPIAHLYKTQVFELARSLAIPAEILERTPTTDTFSLPQTQEEFYFGLPYAEMDLCLYGLNNKVPVREVAQAVGLTPDQVQIIFADILSKRRATRYLHLNSALVTPVLEE